VDNRTGNFIYGADQTFNTIIAPIVSTEAASNIGSTSATLNGNLTGTGDSVPVSVYFDYGLTEDYGYTSPPQEMTDTELSALILQN
jgi:hypothetical protein